MLELTHIDPTSKQKRAAKKLLADRETNAEAAFLAFSVLLGNESATYEPETIRRLMDEHKIEVPEENFDKRQAFLTLTTTTSFFWNALVAEKIILAFNNIDVIPDAVQEPHPYYLSWGFVHAFSIISRYMQDVPVGAEPLELLDYEPVHYAAALLHKHGYVVAPDSIRWLQPRLQEISKDEGLYIDVLWRWQRIDRSKLEAESFAEDEAGVQLSHLAANWLYVEKMHDRFLSDTAALRSGSQGPQ